MEQEDLMQSAFSLLSSSFRLVMAGLEGERAGCCNMHRQSALVNSSFVCFFFCLCVWSEPGPRWPIDWLPPIQHPTSNNKIKSCCDNKGFLFLSSPVDQDAAAVLSRWNGWSDHSANTIWSKMLPLSRSFVLAHVSYLVLPWCPVAYWQSYFSIISLWPELTHKFFDHLTLIIKKRSQHNRTNEPTNCQPS